VTDTIKTEQPWYGRLTIFKGETLMEAVPQFTDSTGNPFDLTDKRFDLYIRPDANDSAHLIAHLTSDSGGEIIITDAENGLVDIVVEVEAIDAADAYPVGEWWHFMDMTFDDPDYGLSVKTVWRGPCIIRADDRSIPGT